MKLFKKTKKGFTLVELVVVIAVIAILAAVSVGAYFGVTESANKSKLEQEAKQAYTNIQLVSLVDSKDGFDLDIDGLSIDKLDDFEREVAKAGGDYDLRDSNESINENKPTVIFSETAVQATNRAKIYKQFDYYIPTISGMHANCNLLNGGKITIVKGDNPVFGEDSNAPVVPDEPDHEHEFINGECSCGEEDPNYEPPHEHNYNENGECSCGDAIPVLSGIHAEIDQETFTSTYYGEDAVFNMTGVTVWADYTCEKPSEDVTDLVTYNSDLSIDQTSVVFTYESKTCDISISVLSIEYSSFIMDEEGNPTKTYIEGQEFDLTSVDFYEVYNNGDKVKIEDLSKLTVTPSTLSVDTTSVEISYSKGGSITVTDIVVEAKTLVNLVVDPSTQNKEYIEGRPIDLTGHTFYAVYDNGTRDEIAPTDITYEATLSLNQTEVEFTYNGFNTKISGFSVVEKTLLSFNVQVRTSITTEYKDGDTFVLPNDIQFTATYNNGSIVVLETSQVTYNATLVAGQTQVAFTFGGKTAYLDIPKVQEAIENDVTITFDSTAKRTEFTTSKQVWKENEITVTNNKAGSTSNVADYANPARFYKNSQIIIEYKNIKNIVFNSVDGNEFEALKGSIKEDSSYTESYNNNLVKIEFNSPVTGFTFTATAGQIKLNSLTINSTQEFDETVTPDVPDDGGGEIVSSGSVKFTVSSTDKVDISGDKSGISATYKSTYNTKCQLTSGNSMTLTISGLKNKTITKITLSMKSNSSKGAGSFNASSGSNTISSISSSKFNTNNWYGNWSTSYVNIYPKINQNAVVTDNTLVLKITSTENSLYCQSFEVEFN